MQDPDGLSRMGPVFIPRTNPAGYPPGIPYGPREVLHTGPEREPFGCVGWVDICASILFARVVPDIDCTSDEFTEVQIGRLGMKLAAFL